MESITTVPTAPVEAPAIPLTAQEQDKLLVLAASLSPRIEPGAQSRSWSRIGDVD